MKPHRRHHLPGACLLVIGLLAGACSSPAGPPPATEPTDPPPATAVQDAPTTVRAYTEGDRVLIERGDERWDFLSGVNLGVTIPGHYPGELAIDAETYRRWFPMMTSLGIRTVRIYTIQRPHFYEELRAYNVAHPDDPLFLVQGVWIDEERFLATQDLYDPQLAEDFRNELTAAVGAVTGEIVLPDKPGHASGSYTADVTPWLVGWILGIELDPTAVAATDEANRAEPSHAGEFFSATAAATPTESWYASQLDHLASELASRDLAMPLAFTNWPTTDPLRHPYEPIATEDLVGIDANNVRSEAAWNGGYFASYHAYPYYPDFQRFEPGLLEYEFQGTADPFAGYLNLLREHHAGLPVVIAEFGVPGGMALAHHGPLGRDQGAHREQDQMAHNAEMMEIIRTQGLAGALIFEWADEWFKRTWNTVDLERPAERRALWSNALNNESYFGLLAIEPGAETSITLDGSLADWTEAGASIIYRGDGELREVLATHDAAYLYLALRLALQSAPGSVTVGFDVLPDEWGGLPGTAGLYPAADAAWILGPGSQAKAQLPAGNDLFAVRHGLHAGHFQVSAADLAPDSGVWNTLRLITSYPLSVPATGMEIPAESFTAGELVHGVTDPDHAKFDSRAAWYRDGETVEIRVPYAAIGISDPSSRQALRVRPDGEVTTEPFESVGIGVVVGDGLHDTTGYGWQPWDSVEWHERLRAGAATLTAVMNGSSNR